MVLLGCHSSPPTEVTSYIQTAISKAFLDSGNEQTFSLSSLAKSKHERHDYINYSLNRSERLRLMSERAKWRVKVIHEVISLSKVISSF